MAALDFGSREQLYYQLYDILFQGIVNGTYAVGDLIPSESELMRTYGVSRATARKAMEMLANNGLITKRRGYGSEVISNQPNTSPRRVVSYIRKNAIDRVTPVKRIVDAKIVPAPADVAAGLQLEEGADVFRLRRVRYSGDQPFYMEINYLEKSMVPDALSRDFSKESLREYLSTACHIKWQYASQEIYAIAADEEKAAFLGIGKGDPLLYIRRISYDVSDVPREFVTSYYRADLYRLEIELGI